MTLAAAMKRRVFIDLTSCTTPPGRRTGSSAAGRLRGGRENSNTDRPPGNDGLLFRAQRNGRVDVRGAAGGQPDADERNRAQQERNGDKHQVPLCEVDDA